MNKTTKEALETLTTLSEKEHAFALDFLRNLAKLRASKQNASTPEVKQCHPFIQSKQTNS